MSVYVRDCSFFRQDSLRFEDFLKKKKKSRFCMHRPVRPVFLENIWLPELRAKPFLVNKAISMFVFSSLCIIQKHKHQTSVENSIYKRRATILNNTENV